MDLPSVQTKRMCKASNWHCTSIGATRQLARACFGCGNSVRWQLLARCPTNSDYARPFTVALHDQQSVCVARTPPLEHPHKGCCRQHPDAEWPGVRRQGRGARLQFSGMLLSIEVVEWTPSAVKVRLPQVELTSDAIADIEVLRPTAAWPRRPCGADARSPQLAVNKNRLRSVPELATSTDKEVCLWNTRAKTILSNVLSNASANAACPVHWAGGFFLRDDDAI